MILTLNSNSLAVVRLQLQLRQLDFYSGFIDGFFDETLRESVKSFQAAYQLQTDGIVGPKTQTVLNTLCNNGWHILFLHCASTPEGRNDKADNVILNHMLPNKTDKGIIFMGKYVTAAEIIGKKIPITGGKEYTITGRELSGRGWSRPGYSDVCELDGKMVNTWKYDNDDMIHEWEQTWGVHGSTLLNRNARHFCYIGGMTADLRNPKDTRTDAQKLSMHDYVFDALRTNPKLIIAGHNQVQNKACPSFDVPQYLFSIGVHEYNIGQWSNKLRI